MKKEICFRLLAVLLTLTSQIFPLNITGNQKMFDEQKDIGKVKLAGSTKYTDNNTIEVTGSGENIWGKEDAFFYAYNKVEGDLSLAMEYKWIGKGKHEHRKAGWMIRAGLEPDDIYVDAVVHGDGLISMQYRKEKGGDTYEVRSKINGQYKLVLERTGDQFTLYVLKDGKTHPAGTISIPMAGQIYAGLAVTSHDSTTKETATFTNVEMNNLGFVEESKRVVESTLETFDIETGVRTIIRQAKEHFEAPNWSRDGNTFIYNCGGKIYYLPVEGGTPKQMNTEFAVKCNNDHGISPDGSQFVISHHREDGKSLIYTLPIKGGKPKLVTKNGPSYWHGWSPDGKTFAYCAERNGNYDVYSIPVEGGDETRLTTAEGLDDGPDYSPDGKYIYFNSVRTKQMKIWRMKVDGSEQIQFTPNDDYGDWFAHPSPDNKWIVFVSYDKNVEGHPANKNVVLRMISTAGGEVKTVATLFGGQGTINVPSWSPDSKHFAFVSYRLVKP